MPESLSLLGLFHKHRKMFLLSLLFFLVAVPIFDGALIQRDRNRNIVYGEIFWQKGLEVYELNDRDLFQNYGVPEDHLLTGVLNVTYEYPVVTLLFYACMAMLDPGLYGPTHFIVNWVLVIFAHLNFLLFAYLGQSYLDNKWFRRLGMLYYSYGFAFSVVFPKVEPFADLLFLSSLVLFQKNAPWRGFTVLSIAVQTKLYPAMVLPLLLPIAPIASVAFFGTSLLLMFPLFLTGMGYESLLGHILNSSGYASIITNPFYSGWILTNPLGIIAPLVLLYSFLLSAFETRRVAFLIVPTRKLRSHDWKVIYVYAIPLFLVLFFWTQIWYYSWFVIPALFLRDEADLENYRWIMSGIWAAHFIGIFANLEYFIEGPIAELFRHFRS
jgi:hypothetical protein